MKAFFLSLSCVISLSLTFSRANPWCKKEIWTKIFLLKEDDENVYGGDIDDEKEEVVKDVSDDNEDDEV